MTQSFMRNIGWLAMLILLAVAGCARPRALSLIAEDISPPRQQRRQEVTEDFNRNRDQAQYQAALAAWEQGNLAGCRESLESLLSRNPDHFEANYLLAELYFLNDQPEQARPILERLIDQQSDVALVHHTLGMVLARLGEPALAEQSLQVAADLEPQNHAYGDSLHRLRAGTAAEDPVVPHYLASHQASAKPPANEDAPSSEPAISPLAQTRTQFEAACQTKAHGKARAVLLQAGAAARGDQATLIALAVMALRQDQPAWAIQALQTFEAGEAASAAYHRTLGTAYYRAGEYKAAEAQLRQALLLDNTSALSYFLLGCTLTRQRRDHEAETQLRQARLLDPRFDRPQAF